LRTTKRGGARAHHGLSRRRMPTSYTTSWDLTLQRPWGGVSRNYQALSGVRVPTGAEVSWGLPEGTFSYWRAAKSPDWSSLSPDQDPLRTYEEGPLRALLNNLDSSRHVTWMVFIEGCYAPVCWPGRSNTSVAGTDPDLGSKAPTRSAIARSLPATLRGPTRSSPAALRSTLAWSQSRPS
jgi:hypothetical protein